MKKCPYCAEEIQDEAIVCRYCGRELIDTGQKLPEKREKSYYNNNEIVITNMRAVFGYTTYSMSNVTSVSMRQEPFDNSRAGWKGFIAIIFILIALACGSSSGNGGAILLLLFLVFGAIGIGFLISAYRSFMNPVISYNVTISSSSGEKKALTSTDEKLIREIVAAMNKAIVERG